MSEAITSKSQMYRLLASGVLGNTIPQYFSLDEWRASGDDQRYPFWGVRTLGVGGLCRLNCPVAEVPATVHEYEDAGCRCNISVMISSVGQVTWLGDIWDSPTGLELNGVEMPPRVHNWRELMRSPTRWTGAVARHLLRKHLNPNSLDDLWCLLERYPGHVVELSAMECEFGVVPGRNAIIWEARAY